MFLVIFNKGNGYFSKKVSKTCRNWPQNRSGHFNIDVIRVDSIRFSFKILQMKFSPCFSIKLDVHVGF